MFKTVQEFTFSINHSNTPYNFTGRLVFEESQLNNIGTLHTEEELSAFGTLLNQAIPIPEYWTLELLAELLFRHARPVFRNLKAVSLNLTESPQRVSEYKNDAPIDYIEGDILELEAIG